MKLALSMLLLILAACEPLPGPGARGGGAPDRAQWQALAMATRAEHARALQMALETLEPEPVAWSGEGASGEVAITGTSDLTQRPVCRTFRDVLEAGGATTEVRDAVCWGETGWFYVAPGVLRPVLVPAYASGERVYTVQSGGTLGAVARRTGADLADLRKLNPNLPDPLTAGTRVLLP